MPASARARSSTRPAGPTNGRPVKSSSLPGASPTSIIGVSAGPSPGTTCVADLQRGQRVHSASAAASARSDLMFGTSSTPMQRPPSKVGSLIQLLRAQAQRVADDASRGGRHGSGGDNRREQEAEEGIERAGRHRHAQRGVDEGGEEGSAGGA